MSAIELNALCKQFAGGRGVTALDLRVEHGEVFGFIGPNGAGKTTTIRTMLGLARRTSGDAKILGVDLERDAARRREALARVGYVPSEPGVYDGLTVGATLAHLGSMHGSDSAARRAELCAKLDLDPRRRADELSLGNKKKLALVAAMQHRPELLVLDEPSNGLDPLVQRALFALLREERDRGAAIFFSSHVLSEVERFCDRFALLRDGALVRELRASDLRGADTRKVRVTFARREGRDRSAVLALAEAPPDDELTLEFVCDRPLLALLDALARDVRDGLVTDASLDHPSLEELVLREYDRASEASHVREA